MAFLEEQVDWLIDARRRWHADDPPRSWRGLIGGATALLLAVAVVERLAAG
jgi:hypothetical protein